jgi:phosphate acetyltransferase
MAKTLMIAAAGPGSGGGAVALGLFEAMSRRVGRVAAFRPVVRAGVEDPFLQLIDRQYPGTGLRTARGVTYDDVHDDPNAAISAIVEAFRRLEHQHDAVLIVGTDYTDLGASTELVFNARVALNLGAPVLLVVSGRDRDVSDIAAAVDVAWSYLAEQGCEALGVVASRVRPEALDAVRAALAHRPGAYAIPELPLLAAPTVAKIFETTRATVLSGAPERLDAEALGFVVAAMTLPRVLGYIEESSLVIAPGDRSDVLVGVLMAHRSQTFPRLSGVLLTGGVGPEPLVQRLIDGLGSRLPLAITSHNTFEAATLASAARGSLIDGSTRKVEAALALVTRQVDTTDLLDRLDLVRTRAVTPLMFEHDLIERASADRRRVVLPEGTEPRVLLAAAKVLQRGVADLVLLGDPELVYEAAARAGADLTGAKVVDPRDPALRLQLANEYVRLRAHKAVTLEAALDVVVDESYAGTLMVQLGLADGMVSGAVHTTAHTIRPAFEIIRTVPGVSVVSSVFFMCLADRVLVYGDCAVNPTPTAEQLADIATSSAATAAAFGVEPRIAMLSYSTGESGHGADVEKVRTATRLVRERAPGLEVEGPIQYDAATDPGVAATKLPTSKLAGRASVLIFPDLNTGNNTYKAVQRSAGALAVGPVLQGLRKPVNDLSRGASVADILTTIAITAVQAQQHAAALIAGLDATEAEGHISTEIAG